jgi:hypothetical protein
MRNTFMVVVLLIGATAIGFAQVDTGGLVGTVKDSSGAALSSVSVTATNVDTGIPIPQRQIQFALKLEF